MKISQISSSELFYDSARSVPARPIAGMRKQTVNAGLRLRLIGEDFHPAVLSRGGVKSGNGSERYFLIRVRHLVTEQQEINRVDRHNKNKHGDDNSF